MYYLSHIPARAVSVKAKGMVDGNTVKHREDEVIPSPALGEAPVDRETAIENNLEQNRSSMINPMMSLLS